MNSSLLNRIVGVLMIVVFPSAMMMADANAMVHANGGVAINGNTITQSSVIFAGDKIQTQKDASAMISHRQSMVRLSADSSVIYEGSSVELNYGVAVIATKNGMVGRLAALSVSPASASGAKFGLVSQKGTQAIVALEGTLQITDGTHTVALASGQTLTHTVEASTQQGGAAPQAGNTNGPEGSANPPQAQQSKDENKGNRNRRRGIPGWGIELIVEGSVGGVVGGLAATGAFDGNKSPSKP